jgi:hypothetical protein
MRDSPGKSKIVKQVEMRIALLRHWRNTEIPWQKGANGNLLKDEDGEPILDFFPRGPTDFANWVPSMHSEGNRSAVFCWKENHDDKEVEFEISIADLKKFSRTNLTQDYHLALAQEAERQITAIKAKAVVQLEKSRKASIISSQEAEIKYLKTVIAQQESECRSARASAQKALTALEAERQTARNNEAQAKRDYQQLEAKMAALIRDFAKISPITASKGRP